MDQPAFTETNLEAELAEPTVVQSEADSSSDTPEAVEVSKTLIDVDRADHVRVMTPIDRLTVLCDPGSLRLIRTAVKSPYLGDRAEDGDGVVAGIGTVAGRPVACYAEDDTLLGGSLGAKHAETIVSLLRTAKASNMPVVGFIASAGARLQEGLEALAGYGMIFRELVELSGQVPLISVICGTCAGGGAYSPALTDVVVMTKRSAMFLTGPQVVQEVTREVVSPEDLGGPGVHSQNGVCQVVADDDLDAVRVARDLLGLLPQSASHEPPKARPMAPPAIDPSTVVPANSRQPYDVRHVVAGIVDGGRLLEISPNWATNVVCALARLDGNTVGIVANQPKILAGTLDADSAQKAAKFVRWCNLMGIPLAVFVDTPGFMPGQEQEGGAVIRHGAKLVHAFAEASVPKVTVILRKAFGGAMIAMNCRALGADFVYAWPAAQIGVMGPEQAVGIINRRDIAAADDPAQKKIELGAQYAKEQITARGAATLGIVDEVIDPSATRDRLVWSLTSLNRPNQAHKRARNIPL